MPIYNELKSERDGRARKNQRIWDKASMSPQKSNQLWRNWLGVRIPAEGEKGRRERDREPLALPKNNDVMWELAFRFYHHTHQPSHVCVCVRMCTYTLCSMSLMGVKSASYTRSPSCSTNEENLQWSIVFKDIFFPLFYTFLLSMLSFKGWAV